MEAVISAVRQGATTALEVAACTGIAAPTMRVLLHRAHKRGLVQQTGYGRYAPLIDSAPAPAPARAPE